MFGKALSAICLLSGLTFLVSCGATPPPRSETQTANHILPADGYIDWAQHDWEFKRHHFIEAYLFQTLPLKDPFGEYVRAMRHDSPFDRLDLDEFLALDPLARNDRRRAGRAHLAQARRFRRTILRAWEILNEGARFATSQLGEAVTDALHEWVVATNVDPSNPYAWYDLSYFLGLVGDIAGQQDALEKCLALPNLSALPDSIELRLRAHLDLAWLLRDQGQTTACLAEVEAAIAIMKADTGRTLDQAREAVLLRGLAMADTGQLSQARRLAKDLRAWPVPLRGRLSENTGGMMKSENKRAMRKIDSNWAQKWIWAVTYLKLEDSKQALAGFSERDMRSEFPPHLHYRYWNDRGRICEHFGEMDRARLNYVNAAVYRPYFIYYQMIGARGLSKIYGQPGTGQLYFLGYRHFYLAGSYFSYAANRVIQMEMESNLYHRARLGAAALNALTVCRQRGLRPASSLALRGRVHYRLGNFKDAEADLLAANDELKALDREDAEVVLMLGIINFDRRDYSGAVPWLNRYTELVPERALGQRLLGVALAHAGRLDKALEFLDQSLVLDPTSATGWYNRSLVQLKQGRLDEARQGLEQARKLWPENPDIIRLIDLTKQDLVPEIKLTSQQVTLRVSEADSLKYLEANIVSSLQLVPEAGQESGLIDPQTLLPDLETAYARDNSQTNRTRLAWALLQVEDYVRVRRLLVPQWNQGLTQEELIILLRADRAEGLTVRAKALAVSLGQGAEPLPNAGLWELVAVICLENGLGDLGYSALTVAVSLDPDNANLRTLQQHAR